MEDSTVLNKNFCQCGCEKEIEFFTKDGKPKRWKSGHNIIKLHESGITASHWKGGIRKMKKGYITQYQPNHKFASKQGTVYQHRLIWEDHHKACLLTWADIHHINGIKDDNQPENLEAMMKAKHTYRHAKQDLSDRFCSQCNQKTYIDYHGYGVWHRDPRNKNHWLCRKCYRRLMWSLGKPR